MKQKSINLLTSFLECQFKDCTGFSFIISPEDNFDDYWFFTVTITDEEEEITFDLRFRVDYKADMIFLEMDANLWESVADYNWTCKHFWYKLYCCK